MKKIEIYCNRFQSKDCDELLDGLPTFAKYDVVMEGHDAYEKPLRHSYQIRAFFVVVALTIFTSSLGILTTLSQKNGGYEYNYATIPFLAEVFKFIICSYLLWMETKSQQSIIVAINWKNVFLYLIPSIIYLVHNNVQFLTLTYIDTSTHQIMGNLKIVTTGILFRTFLKKKLSRLQWIAIMLLTIGTTVSQVKGCGQIDCGNLLAAPIQGYLLGILSSWLSALAGVYIEYLMKKNYNSLYWQNMQLYAFGILFNIIRLTVDDFQASFSKGPWWYHLLNGYNIITWLVVLNLSVTGLLVSWIMKYADNIVKVYATSMAMLLTMILSIKLFNSKPTLQLFLGILICCISLQLYYIPMELLVGSPILSQTSPCTNKCTKGYNMTIDSESDAKRKNLSFLQPSYI